MSRQNSSNKNIGNLAKVSDISGKSQRHFWQKSADIRQKTADMLTKDRRKVRIHTRLFQALK